MLFNFICRNVPANTRYCINLKRHCHEFVSSSSHQSYQFATETSHSSKQRSFTVDYLINSCGISPESANLASRRLNLLESPNTANYVLAFLNNQGFTDSQVSKVISSHPKILLCDIEKTLLPSFQILKSIGFSNADLVTIIITRPKEVLEGKFQDKALLSVKYLKAFLGSNDRVINAIKRFPQALTYDLQVYADQNIRMLLELGVPESRIKAMLAQQPRTFLTSADSFRKVVSDVKEMGIDPSKSRFLWAIHALRGMSKLTWNKKVELYKKWGWSEDEVLLAFEKHPWCMIASMDKITRILDFLVNTMGCDRSYIIRIPIVFSFSIDKRIIPRCLAYKFLAVKRLTEENDDIRLTLSPWLIYSETIFLKWVEKKYVKEAPELLKLYQKLLNGSAYSTMQICKTGL